MQDQTSVQTLLNNATSSQTSNAQFDQLGQKIESVLLPAFFAGSIISLIIFVYVLANAIRNWRVHSAILRIDKNLKKLVDAQVAQQPTTPLQATEQPNQIQPLPTENK